MVKTSWIYLCAQTASKTSGNEQVPSTDREALQDRRFVCVGREIASGLLQAASTFIMALPVVFVPWPRRSITSLAHQSFRR